MIIVHDADLNVQGVIYVHPTNYSDVLDKGGHRWVHVREAAPLDKIKIGRNAETGLRMVKHGDAVLTTVAQSSHP
jgi:hypothetical protein